jgi:hypothetical protein
MVDPRASLFLRAPFDPDREYEMVIQGWLYHSSAGEPARVQVLVNDTPVGELVSRHPDAEPRGFRIEIAGVDLARKAEATITFVTVPPDEGKAPREPLALQTFVLRPLDGTKTTSAETPVPAP